LLHSGHLIHDDLIDADDERRGKPTFHIQLKNELNKVYKNLEVPHENELANNYGRDLSILGGTQGYLLGLNVIKTSRFSDILKLQAINEYAAAMDSLMKGQIIEEYMNYHNITMTLEQYLAIAEMQRASLLEKSVKIGAILAKGNFHYQINPLSKAMNLMGQAFAIRDDIIDIKSDIKAKKKKIVYIFAVQNTDEEQSKTLNEIYHLEKLSSKDVKEVEIIFTETNAVIIAEHFSKNLISQAKATLKDIYPDLNKDQKTFFNEFSDFMYMRDF
jgi:geranylgeranyl pyrophosphate synthase